MKRIMSWSLVSLCPILLHALFSSVGSQLNEESHFQLPPCVLGLLVDRCCVLGSIGRESTELFNVSLVENRAKVMGFGRVCHL